MVSHYGHNYSAIMEKSKCNTLRFYISIESRYGGNRFTMMVLEQNENSYVMPTVCKCLPLDLLLDLILQDLLEADSQELL